MRTLMILAVFIFIAPSAISAQETLQIIEPAKEEPTVRLPVNLYDSLAFSEQTAPYVKYGLYIAAPTFFFIYGVTTWGWTAGQGFEVNPETCFGNNAVHGAADKFGHMYAGYLLTRMSYFLFRSSGSSQNMANLEGAILSEFTTLASEIGDGFSPDYGFDPYDFAFNNLGIILGLILNWSPVLDRIFAYQIEYFPSKDMRDRFSITHHHDLPTDYGGTKFMLATKFAGIPYLSLTPVRYFNFDVGYYSRGYDQRGYHSRTKNVYLGVSINLSIAFGDLLPTGYTSSSIQSAFNYVHVPLDYEFKKFVISRSPKTDPGVDY